MGEREAEALRLRAEIFKALGHPTRLWIVERLAEGECCVADLAAGVEGGLSAVSQHLALLRQVGIVRDTRRGRQIYYSLTFPFIADMCAMLGGKAPEKPSALERLRKLLPVLTLLSAESALFLLGHHLGAQSEPSGALAQLPSINTHAVVLAPSLPETKPLSPTSPRQTEDPFRYSFPAPFSH